MGLMMGEEGGGKRGGRGEVIHLILIISDERLLSSFNFYSLSAMGEKTPEQGKRLGKYWGAGETCLIYYYYLPYLAP